MPPEGAVDREPTAHAADPVEQPIDPVWRRAFAKVEALVGGRVVSAERQPRWRPAWFLEVERTGGERVPVYFRGDRGQGQGGGGALERELCVLRVLARHDVPVPHVFGFCDAPRGIVMERAPGRANLATAADEQERARVLDHYMELLARMHAIDPAAFADCGLPAPPAEAPVWIDFPRWEKGYRRGKSAPEPLIELCIRWLRHHAPEARRRVGFLTGDAGQFLFEEGRVTAVIDLELATLGDPLADLGALRSRDVSEPLGDLSRGLRRYAEVSGEPLDRAALAFHAVRFALNTPLAVAPLCQRPPPGLDYAQYLGWKQVYGRLALEIIAEEEGVALEPPALPDAAPPSDPALDALLAMLEGLRGTVGYEADAAHRVGLILQERRRHGDACEAAFLDDVAALLARRPGSFREADAWLEERVLAPDFAVDADWIRLLHRRAVREEALLRPALRELRDARFQKLRLDGADRRGGRPA